jgi:drug/metabolite transporter (DMT)-like permease
VSPGENPRTMNQPIAAQPPGITWTRLLLPLALLSVYLIWGSTYMAISVALQSWPPFMMASIRFLIAGAALYAGLRMRGMPSPTRRQWLNAAFAGSLLLGIGNGAVCYAQQTVASGLAAIAIASMPLFAAIFGVIYKTWPSRVEWLGLVIGFSGVILLNFGNGLDGSPLGAVALIMAACAWAFGSVWSQRQDMPPALMNTAAQMLCGGVILGVVALLHGERLHAMPSLPATLSLAYLIVFGSLVAFSAYLYLLNNVRPLLATSYAYVNPPVAVLLGMLFLGEQVHGIDVFAMLVILAGVALIAFSKATRRAPTTSGS